MWRIASAGVPMTANLLSISSSTASLTSVIERSIGMPLSEPMYSRHSIRPWRMSRRASSKVSAT